MSNVLAIANKELRSYFSSPIAYIAIGMFALLYGWFFVAILAFFVRQSMQMGQLGMQGPQAMNINQQMIRPLLQNVTILILFLMPMVTMRTYSEEKRSGTIELLLTSPLTDFQIVLGKFLGAMALYAVMLAVTLIHIGFLFLYGRPEWKPILTAYIVSNRKLALRPHSIIRTSASSMTSARRTPGAISSRWSTFRELLFAINSHAGHSNRQKHYKSHCKLALH